MVFDGLIHWVSVAGMLTKLAAPALQQVSSTSSTSQEDDGGAASGLSSDAPTPPDVSSGSNGGALNWGDAQVARNFLLGGGWCVTEGLILVCLVWLMLLLFGCALTHRPAPLFPVLCCDG